MIPYFGWTSFQLGPITIYTWGLFVALGYLLGTYLAFKRAKSLGLDGERVLDLATWIFFGSFIAARLFHVAFYDDGTFLSHPLQILNPRVPGFSMMGGLLGAFVAGTVYLKKHSLDWITYADTVIWGLPWGCGVGRIGCFFIHDHPGTLTHSLLGVRYPDGQTRHDHGLYLSLLGFAVGILFLLLNKKTRKPGFWLGWYLVIDGMARFILDFYRINDATYFSLTPSQWVAIPFIAVGLYTLRTRFESKKRV